MTEEFDSEGSLFQKLMDSAYARWKENEKKWRSFTAFVHNLSSDERTAVLIGKLNQQVTNGGFAQWCDNDYAEPLRELKASLDLVGTKKSKQAWDLACRARGIYNVQQMHYDDGYECDFMNDKLDALDEEFYLLNDALLFDCEAFFQANAVS